MKEGGSVGGKEARSLKPENPWNENISFAKHDLKTDQVYGLFGSHQMALLNPVGPFSDISLEILSVVCFTSEITTPLHTLSNVLFIQEKLCHS